MPSFLSSLLFGISGPSYESLEPALDLTHYFSGRIEGQGMIQDRGGNVTARFTGVMECWWQGDQGTFDETFDYLGDGMQQKRVWKVQRLDKTRYQATADDILGLAKGRSFGNAMNWRYRMDVPHAPGKTIRLSFDDWMWAIDDRHVLNRSYMKAFGIKVAELTFAMKKV